MKKFTQSVLFIAALALVAQSALAMPAFAESPTSTAKRAEAQVRRDAHQADVNTRREAIMKRFAERMVLHFNKLIDRLENLADRLDSRITKIETEKGISLADAKAKLAAARAKIAAAQTQVNGIMTAVNSALAAHDGLDALRAVKKIIGDARDAIRDAHKALVEAIRLAKGSLEGIEHATSTPHNDD